MKVWCENCLAIVESEVDAERVPPGAAYIERLPEIGGMCPNCHAERAFTLDWAWATGHITDTEYAEHAL